MRISLSRGAGSTWWHCDDRSNELCHGLASYGASIAPGQLCYCVVPTGKCADLLIHQTTGPCFGKGLIRVVRVDRTAMCVWLAFENRNGSRLLG